MSFPEKWVLTVSLSPPDLHNNIADADRLMAELKRRFKSESVSIDLPLLRELPHLLRKWNYRLQVLCFKEKSRPVLVAAGDPGAPAVFLGLAIDLGTTQVVLRIIDLENGAILAESAFINPQTACGPDILARIHHTDRPGGLDELNRLIMDGLNRHIGQLCAGVKLEPQKIVLAAVSGNTAMGHLFLGLDPHWLIREPYIPALNRPPLLKAAELGLELNPAARVFVFPNIGSYFGGDLICGILAAGIHKSETTALMVDVGTNAEVVLGNRDWFIGCAGAAGPALEGGVTRMGMTAGPGVIDQVRIDPQTREIQIRTIEDLKPVGICGTGLIDLAAQLFLAQMIDIRGKFVPENCDNRLRKKDGLNRFVLVEAQGTAEGREIALGQADLDSLIRSKAAMFTILETITAAVGMTPEELEAFYVAGTFGTLLNPESAITIGMLPDIARERFQSLGNSSLAGATQILLSPACLEEVEQISDRLTYLELNVNQDFMQRFSAARFLPHTDLSRFPSVSHAASDRRRRMLR